MIRDIARKIGGDDALQAIFAKLLALARRVHAQERGQRGPKVYSLHAPEVECIGKGASASPLRVRREGLRRHHAQPRQGRQFVAYAKAAARQSLRRPHAGDDHSRHGRGRATIGRVLADAGYRGHNAPPEYKFRSTAGQKRGVTDRIRDELRRRPAVEPVIGPLKEDHRMGRNYLALPTGDAANAVLAAAGYNFRRLIRWLAFWLACALAILAGRNAHSPRAKFA